MGAGGDPARSALRGLRPALAGVGLAVAVGLLALGGADGDTLAAGERTNSAAGLPAGLASWHALPAQKDERGQPLSRQPRALAWNGRDLFVADRAAVILRYLLSGENDELVLVNHWEMPEARNGNPAALCWDPTDAAGFGAGTLLIGETHYGRISRYDADGELLDQFGRAGNAPGELSRIQGVEVTPAGDILVVETYAHTERVQVFDANGVWLKRWGGPGAEPGRFNRPRAVKLSPAGEVMIADSANHRVQVFDLEGELLRVLTPPELRYPFDLAFDGAGRLHIVELTGSRVLRLEADGAVTSACAPGAGVGRLAQPWGVEVTTEGLVFVADTGNDRLVWFRLDDEPATGEGDAR